MTLFAVSLYLLPLRHTKFNHLICIKIKKNLCFFRFYGVSKLNTKHFFTHLKFSVGKEVEVQSLDSNTKRNKTNVFLRINIHFMYANVYTELAFTFRISSYFYLVLKYKCKCQTHKPLFPQNSTKDQT